VLFWQPPLPPNEQRDVISEIHSNQQENTPHRHQMGGIQEYVVEKKRARLSKNDKLLMLQEKLSGLYTTQEKLEELNRGIITDENVDEILRRLKFSLANFQGNEEFLAYLSGQKTVYVEKERRGKNIVLSKGVVLYEKE